MQMKFQMFSLRLNCLNNSKIKIVNHTGSDLNIDLPIEIIQIQDQLFLFYFISTALDRDVEKTSENIKLMNTCTQRVPPFWIMIGMPVSDMQQ